MSSSGKLYIVKQAKFNECDFPFKTDFKNVSCEDSEVAGLTNAPIFQSSWQIPTCSVNSLDSIITSSAEVCVEPTLDHHSIV